MDTNMILKIYISGISRQKKINEYISFYIFEKKQEFIEKNGELGVKFLKDMYLQEVFDAIDKYKRGILTKEYIKEQL